MTTTLVLLFVFLSITFGYSAYEKITAFRNSETYYSNYIKNRLLSRNMKLLLSGIIFFEIVISLALAASIIELVWHHFPFAGWVALVCAAVLLIVFMTGQRIARDYEGAKGTAVYFLLCLLGILLIEFFF
ncbi:MAG: hypothetical protein Q4G08_01655 [Capnocytophaga sp.]|nr:hypothetical protein [Capnocytophaga sp.]